MSSSAASFDDVFFRQVVESSALFTLSPRQADRDGLSQEKSATCMEWRRDDGCYVETLAGD